MDSVVVLGSDRGARQAAARARALGLRVLTAQGGTGVAELADTVLAGDAEETEALARAARGLDVAGVVGSTGTRVAAARLALRLGLPGIPPHLAALLVDPAAQRRLLAEAGLPIVQAARRARRETLGRGSTPLARVAPLAAARGVREDEAGCDLLVAGIVVAGRLRAILETDRLAEAHDEGPLQITHVHPTQADWRSVGAARELAARAVDVLGLAMASARVRLRLEGGAPRLVDVAALPGAGPLVDLVEEVSGIDLIEARVLLSIGRGAELLVEAQAAAASGGAVARYLGARRPEEPARAGTHLALAPPTRLARARAVPGVTALELYVAPGDAVSPLDRARVGHVLTRAPTREAALARAREAEAELSLALVAAPHAHG